MTGVMDAGTLELVELDINLNDEIACEFLHNGSNPPCTGPVTHRARSCQMTVMICDAGADHDRKAMAGYHICRGCGCLISACWTVTPV